MVDYFWDQLLGDFLKTSHESARGKLKAPVAPERLLIIYLRGQHAEPSCAKPCQNKDWCVDLHLVNVNKNTNKFDHVRVFDIFDIHFSGGAKQMKLNKGKRTPNIIKF